jgi:hypothetical protein
MNNKHFVDVANAWLYFYIVAKQRNSSCYQTQGLISAFPVSTGGKHVFFCPPLMVHSSTVIPLKNKVKLHNIKIISSTPQKTHCASITKTKRLTPFREISLFILRTTWKHIHSVAQNALLLHMGASRDVF